MLTTSEKVGQFGKAMDTAAASLPAEEAVRKQMVMVVNAPTAFLVANGPIIQYWAGRPAPLRIRMLGTGLGELAIERRDDRTLALRPVGGYFAEPGTLPGDPPASLMYPFTPFDRMYYGGEPFERGTEIALPDPVVTIEETTPEGRPAAVSFRFERPLEDPAYRWLKWEEGVYAPFDLPEIGASVTAPPVKLSINSN